MSKMSLPVAVALALLAGAAATAPAYAAVGGTLKIYSAYPNEQMKPLVDAFNKKYPDVNIQISVQPGEELLSTIELELRANSPHADVVGLNQASIDALEGRHHAMEAYEPADLAGVRAVDRDPNNIVIPACINPYLIQYNTNKITAADAPKTWLDLLDPKWKGQIAMADPAKSQSIHSFIWFITVKMATTDPKDYGWGYFKKLSANDVRLESSHGTIRDLTASGERPIGIQLLANGQTAAKRGDPTAIVWPPAGSPGELSAFAMFKGAANPEAAKAWLDFVVSKDGQNVMPDALGCAPVRDDVSYTLPGGTAIKDVNIIPVDSAYITAHRQEQTTDFRKAMGQ